MLSNIRVNTADTDTGWVDVVAGPKEFDLLQLKTSGVAGLLGQVTLETGHYTQLRMDVEFVSAVIDGQTVTTGVDIPSTVLRLVASFEIRENQLTVLTIDFDADKSLVFTGDGKTIFKPTVSMTVEYPD